MPEATRRRVLVLADDLIWGTRIATLVRSAGGDPVLLRSGDTFRDALTTPDAAPASPAVVDMTARAYDPAAAIRIASEAGMPVLAVAQHDAVEQRRSARAAGASRVLAYRQLAEDGERIMSEWLSISDSKASAGTPIG